MRKIFALLMLTAVLSASAQKKNQKANDAELRQSSVELSYAHQPVKLMSDDIIGESNIGLDLVFKHVVVGGSYFLSDRYKYEDNHTWQAGETKYHQGLDLHLGGNYRYFFGDDLFFVEARVLFGYYNMKSKNIYLGSQREVHQYGFGRIYRENDEYNDVFGNLKLNAESLYAAVMPRVGVTGGAFSAFIGPQWRFANTDMKFNKIMFDKKFNALYVNIGIGYVF